MKDLTNEEQRSQLEQKVLSTARTWRKSIMLAKFGSAHDMHLKAIVELVEFELKHGQRPR